MIEPLYSIYVAAELVPCSVYVIEHMLSRRAREFDPPMYNMYPETGNEKEGKGNRAIRMLYEHEVLHLRELVHWKKLDGARSTAGMRRIKVHKYAGLLNLQVG